MPEPEVLVIGYKDATLSTPDLMHVTVLAAAALACMAALGNADPATVEKSLRAVLYHLERLSPEFREDLDDITREIVAAALAGKSFVCVGAVTVTPPPRPN